MPDWISIAERFGTPLVLLLLLAWQYLRQQREVKRLHEARLSDHRAYAAKIESMGIDNRVAMVKVSEVVRAQKLTIDAKGERHGKR